MAQTEKERAAQVLDGVSIVDSEVVRALAATGFHAIQRNQTAAATMTFRFLQTVRPGTAFVAVGLGLAAMTEGRHSDAVAILAEASSRLPDDAEVRGFHALALMLHGDVSAARAVRATLSEAASMNRFAECLGDEINRRAAPSSALHARLV